MEARLNEEALDVRGAEGMGGLRRGTVRLEQVRISIEPQHPRHLAKHGYRLKIRTAGNARDHALEGLVGEGESLAVPALELGPAGDTPPPHGDGRCRGRATPGSERRPPPERARVPLIWHPPCGSAGRPWAPATCWASPPSITTAPRACCGTASSSRRRRRSASPARRGTRPF